MIFPGSQSPTFRTVYGGSENASMAMLQSQCLPVHNQSPENSSEARWTEAGVLRIGGSWNKTTTALVGVFRT